MPVLPQATRAAFKGVKNGRPVFDFGDGVPPGWLLEDLDKKRGEVRDGAFYWNGKPLELGQIIGQGLIDG